MTIHQKSQKIQNKIIFQKYISSEAASPKVLLGKSILIICSKFTGEHPCRSVISIKLLCNFIEITLEHGCLLDMIWTWYGHDMIWTAASVSCRGLFSAFACTEATAGCVL